MLGILAVVNKTLPERLRQIFAPCEIRVVSLFFTSESCPDHVMKVIDSVGIQSVAALADRQYEHGIVLGGLRARAMSTRVLGFRAQLVNRLPQFHRKWRLE